MLAAWPHAQQPPASPQQPNEVVTTITSDGGAAPRLAVPDFIALTKDAETVAIAKQIGQVLWDDLAFEKEFAFIPRDTYGSIPAATSFADVPFDRWRELNADGLIIGTVQKTGATIKVEMRLFNVRTRVSAFGREYSSANARLVAHTISDEVHKSQRALNGVARTKLTFDSDRDGERMSGTVESRGVKEIYTRRLRRREPAAHHHRTHAEHRAALVAGRPVDRVHVVPPRRRAHLHFEHLRRHARRSDAGLEVGRELAARVVARRHADRVHVHP